MRKFKTKMIQVIYLHTITTNNDRAGFRFPFAPGYFFVVFLLILWMVG